MAKKLVLVKKVVDSIAEFEKQRKWKENRKRFRPLSYYGEMLRKESTKRLRRSIVQPDKYAMFPVYRLVYKVTRNNVYILVFDPFGKPLFYSSGGLKYSQLNRESLPTANILLGENLGSCLVEKDIVYIDFEFHGLASREHRQNFIKGMYEMGITIRSVLDKTPISHNGCSRKKKRRTPSRRKLI